MSKTRYLPIQEHILCLIAPKFPVRLVGQENHIVAMGYKNILSNSRVINFKDHE